MASAAVLLGLVLALPLPVPFVGQHKDTCGPAALAMVLGYWGREVDHDQLARELHARDLRGVKGSRLSEAARGRGLRSWAFRGDLEHLREQVGKGRPVIVAWDMGKGRAHNVVVVGVAAEGVVVHDPARGAFRTLPVPQFEEPWARAGFWSLLVTPP
jgi:ABC-type bacteriocin/lantibiotic exporter with double-glycine peptidase domain